MVLNDYQTESNLILTATLSATKRIKEDVLQEGLYGWMWLDAADAACHLSSHRVW